MRFSKMLLVFLLTGGTTVSAVMAQKLPEPPLSMRNIQYTLIDIGSGAFAILPDLPTRNGNGFIVGSKGVLVVDSILNRKKTAQMLDLVRQTTGKPILYAVNTNYNCDHVCGNSGFPDSTTIIAHRLSVELMQDYEGNRAVIASFLPDNEQDLLSEIQAPARMPDLTFEKKIVVDLGDRAVEIWHFGTGNTPGDAVVYDPASKTAWVGNLLFGRGMVNIFSFHGDASEYAATLKAMRDTLDLEHIVPGHMLSGVEPAIIVDEQIFYAEHLALAVKSSIEAGLDEDGALTANPLSSFPKPPGVKKWLNTLGNAHELNFRKTYRVTSAKMVSH